MDDSLIFKIIDGHNDTLLNLYQPKRGQDRSFFERSDIGHLDLPRAKAGGFAGGLFAIFVPEETPPEEDNGNHKNSAHASETEPEISRQYAQAATAGMISLLEQLEADSDQQFMVVRSYEELIQCLDSETIAAILHFEGAECIEPDLSNLEAYYERGLRSLGLTWSRRNEFAHGVPFKFPSSPDTGPGLTAAGRQLVKACNEMGILIDLSHLNEKGFREVAKLSKTPLVATHSGVHEICPSSRNLTDDQIDAIADSEGLIGVNFHVGFLRPDGKNDPDTPLTEIINHVEYIAERIGIDYVALGSDFDGAKMPTDLKDAAGLPKLMLAFQAEGYSIGELNKLAHENWLRVLEQTWKS